MKKILSAVIAALLMMALLVPAMAEGAQIGQVLFAAHGTKCFAVLTVAVEGDKIVDAYIDEFQMMGTDVATGVPNSEAMIAVEGQVLGSKRVNNEYYSALMADHAKATVEIAANYDAIEAYVIGKTVAELEAELTAKTAEELVDAVAGCTLVDTMGYMTGLLEAAKTVK